MLETAISFRDFTAEDVSLLQSWLSMPHVSPFWQESENEEDLRKKFPVGLRQRGVVPFIVLFNDDPVGYAQYYEACKIGGGWWEGYGPGVFGMDLLIGEPVAAGRGIGTATIRLLLADIFRNEKASCVICDPEPSNLRAVRAYEKAGFKKAGEIDTPGGRALLMKIEKLTFI